MRMLALLVAACAAAFVVAGANAAQHEQFAIQVQDSFVAPFMSAACGVPVTITLDGVARVSLTRNDDGLVVKEHDVLSSFTATFASPLALGGTGLSFTNRSPGVATFDYGEGAAIGSSAVITLTGLQGPAAGASSSVAGGYQRLIGTVYGFSPEGIPLVDFHGPVTSQHGLWPDFLDVVLPERCEALGGSLQP
jgi:hypothetical protein